MKNFFVVSTAVASLVFGPLFVSAVAQTGTFNKTSGLLSKALGIVNGLLIPLLLSLALLLFFWGMVKYIWSSGTNKDEGKKVMVWGVIALFVMTSIWGIVEFIRQELDVDQKTEVTIPTIKKS